MKKVNFEEKTRIINEFRMSNQNKTFTGRELNEALVALGFTKTQAAHIAQSCFPFEKMGVSRLYAVPVTPIHKSFIESLYVQARKKAKEHKQRETSELFSQQQAWDTLVEAGIIRTKFNLNTLKTKYPKVYLDCLEYELVNPNSK